MLKYLRTAIFFFKITIAFAYVYRGTGRIILQSILAVLAEVGSFVTFIIVKLRIIILDLRIILKKNLKEIKNNFIFLFKLKLKSLSI